MNLLTRGIVIHTVMGVETAKQITMTLSMNYS